MKNQKLKVLIRQSKSGVRLLKVVKKTPYLTNQKRKRDKRRPKAKQQKQAQSQALQLKNRKLKALRIKKLKM